MLHIRYTLWNVPFHSATRNDVKDIFAKMLEEDRMHMVFTPNPEIMLVSEEIPEYKEVLKQAFWNLPDGNGLLWASTFLEESKGIKNPLRIICMFMLTYSYLLFSRKKLTKAIPETITGSDTFFNIHSYFAEKGTKVFYFGGANGVEYQILPVMKKKYPGLKVVGSCGGFPFRSVEENERILIAIEKAEPEVLFVALNFPKQERWIYENRERLEKAGVRVAMGIGGTFDFAVGKIKRAPQWMRNMHIEWLWRLIKQPSRIGRIFKAVLYFPFKVLQKRLSY